MVVDPVAEQPTDLADQPLADGPGTAVEHPQQDALDHARQQGRAGQLLGVGPQLERQRQQDRGAQHQGRQVEFDVGGDVGQRPVPPAGDDNAPLRGEGRVAGVQRGPAQADLSFASTLSLRRPVAGRLFCFWYARRAFRVSALKLPVGLPL
jgi:hypothetical protein